MSQNQNKIKQNINNLSYNIKGIQNNISSISIHIDKSIEDVKYSINGLKQNKNKLQLSNDGIDNSLFNIFGQTNKIDFNVKSILQDQKRQAILGSTKNINFQANLIQKFNQQNKQVSKSIDQLGKKLQQSVKLQKIALQQANKAKQQLIKSREQAASIKSLNEKNIQQAQQAKKQAILAKKQSQNDNRKIKELQEAHNNKIYTICYWVLGIGIFTIAAGIASIFAQIVPLKLSIASIVSGIILVSVSSCIIKWLQEMQIIGAILIGLTFLSLIGITIWMLINRNKATCQLTQFVGHVKEKINPELKQQLFTAKNNIADLVQSNSTKAIVSDVRKKINQSHIKLQLEKIKNKI